MNDNATRSSESKRLQLLFVEDNPKDVKLISHSLSKAGFALDADSVDSIDGFNAQISRGEYDVIICDYNLLGSTAMDVLEALHRMEKDIPLIVVSGSVGDEAAAECIKRGAMDYVLKDRMARLPASVEAALAAKSLRALRKRAESALRESEEEYRLLFDSNPNPMWVFDLETLAFVAVNDAAIQRYGYSREEFLRMTARDIRPPEDVPAFLARLEQQRDQKVVPASAGIVKHQTKSGAILEVEISGNHIEFRGRRSRLVLANDMTERNNLQAQLVQAQKMESLGQLAGGVAHDINNLIGVVLGEAELMKETLDDAAATAEGLDAIMNAGQRIAGIVKQLLAFSRKQVRQPKPVDLNSVIAGMRDLLQRLIGEDVMIAIDTEPQLWTTFVDPGQIEQVVMNLAVNAHDAMPQGGTLTIRTSNVVLDEVYTRQHSEIAPGEYIMLSVADTGSGMTAATIARIFEPFFTTKALGHGTGLGLATVYGIVRQSGGTIWVYSDLGQGTTFKIYLPRLHAPAQPVRQRHAPQALPSGTETILVVEDAEAVRSLAYKLLNRAGYTVLDAEGPTEAIRIATDHPNVIHAVLTDVVMPGMSGPDLAKRLHVIRPDMRFLFMSGYADVMLIRRGVLDESIVFVEKPFSAASLLQKLRDVLDGS